VHLGRCPDCRVFLEQFQTTITSAREETESDTAVVMPEELIRAVLESTRKR